MPSRREAQGLSCAKRIAISNYVTPTRTQFARCLLREGRVKSMQHDLNFYVYIMASHKNGSIYTGMTNDLIRRVQEHKSKASPKSHTAKYNITRLVYFEIFNSAEDAILREKFVKKLTRARRVKLIEADNPQWHELYKGDETVPW